MKTWLSMLGILVIGAVLGVLFGISQFPPVPKVMPGMDELAQQNQSVGPEVVAGGAVEQGSNAVNGEKPEKKQPKIKIDEEIYDFGRHGR